MLPSKSNIVFTEQGLDSLNPGGPPFPNDLTQLRLVKHYPGGSGGVYELTDGQSFFMLKLAESESHLKQEILADTLYLRLGANVPRFAVYKDIPKALQEELGIPQNRLGEGATICRLSEKIEGTQPSATLDVAALLKNKFILYAYLCNRDIKPENLILTDDHDSSQAKVYCIDNGAFLATRSRGELNSDAINHVIDLETLRNPNISTAGAQFFTQITQDEIKQQIDELLKKQDVILNTAIEMNEILHLDFFEETYEQLVARLHSLAYDDLAGYSSEKKTAIDKKPSEGDAAGILSIAYIQGKPYVLLGCRNGTHHGTWCNLGGKSEPSDKTFQETAAREVVEESNGVLVPQSDEISFHPYFELSIDTGLYRMYCSPTPYRKASLMNEHLDVANSGHNKEYEQFAWFSLESVLKGLATNSPRMTVEQWNESTGDPKKPMLTTIELYPKMYQMLQSPGVSDALSAFVTQQPPKLPLRVVELKTALAETMLQRSELIKEFKSKHSKKPAPVVTTDNAYSLSEHHLDLLLKTSNKTPLNDKINNFFDTLAQNPANAYDLGCRAQLKAAIEKEGEYQAQGYLTLYHAVPHEISILYDLYTALYQNLLLLPDSDVKKFRLSELPFKKYNTLDAFMAHFAEHGKINNYDEDFPDIGLSANVFAFGSHRNNTSASYQLFADDSASRGVKLIELLATKLAEMGIREPLIQLLLGRLKKIMDIATTRGSTLYQIHLPKVEMDHYAYPAVTLGAEYRLKDEKKSLSTLLDAFATKQWDDYDDITTLQARLFVHPETMKKAVVLPYHHHPLDQDKEQRYKQAIRDGAGVIFQALIQNQNTEAMFVKNPASNMIYQQQLAALTGLESNVNPVQLLASILNAHQYVKIPYILNLYPTLFSSEDAKTELNSAIKSMKDFTVGNFNKILKFLSEVQRSVVIEATKNLLPGLIESYSDFNTILEYLSEGQRAVVFEATKGLLPTLIISAHTFKFILEYLSEEQRSVVFEATGDSLPALIKSADDFSKILKYLSKEQRSVVFEATKGLLPTLIKDVYDFDLVLNYLSEAQTAVVIEATKDLLPVVIKSVENFKFILRHVSNMQAVVFIATKVLPLLIQSIYDFNYMLLDLSKEMTAVVMEATKGLIPMLIQSTDDFRIARKDLSQEQKTVVIEATKDLLPALVKSARDFNLVLRELFELFKDQAAVVETTKNVFRVIIKSADDFNGVLRQLSQAQTAVVIEATKDLLPELIKSGHDFDRAVSALSREQITLVLEAIKDLLPKIIKSVDDFRYVKSWIGGENSSSSILFEATKDLLPALIKSVNDFDFVLENLTVKQQVIFFLAVKDLLPTSITSAAVFKKVLKKYSLNEKSINEEVAPALEPLESSWKEGFFTNPKVTIENQRTVSTQRKGPLNSSN